MAVKLEKFVVKNFKSIGSKPVEIELDEIVILNSHRVSRH